MKKSLVTSLALVALVASHLGSAAHANVSQESMQTISNYLKGNGFSTEATAFGEVDGAESNSTINFIAESISKNGVNGKGIRLVRTEQRIGGKKVFGSNTHFTLNHEGDQVITTSFGQLQETMGTESDVAYEASAAVPFLNMGYGGLANLVIAELGLDPYSQTEAPEIEEGWWPLADGTAAPATRIIVWTEPLAYEAFVNPVTGEVYHSECITYVEDHLSWSPIQESTFNPMEDIFSFNLPKVSFEYDAFNVFGGEELFEDGPADVPAGDTKKNTSIQEAYFLVYTQQPYLTSADLSGMNQLLYSQELVDKLRAAGVEDIEYYKWAPLQNPGASTPTMWSKDGTNYGGGTQDGKPGNGWHGAPRQRSIVPQSILAHPVASPHGWLADVPAGKTIASIDISVSDDFNQYAGWTTEGNNANVYRGRVTNNNTPGHENRAALSGDYTRLTQEARDYLYSQGLISSATFNPNIPSTYTSWDYEFPLGRPVFTDRYFVISDDVARPAPSAYNLSGDLVFFPLTSTDVVDPFGGSDPLSDLSGDKAYESVKVQQAAQVNGFYISNFYHDLFYLKGFDEAAGNFQKVNYTGEGVGGDAVRVRLQYGSTNRKTTSVNNSSFSSSSTDGSQPSMQGYVFNGGLRPFFNDLYEEGDEMGWNLLTSTMTAAEREAASLEELFHDYQKPFRDVGFEAETFAHELTHGTNARLARALPADEGYCDLTGLMAFNVSPYNNEDGPYARGQYGYFMLPFNRRPFNFGDWKADYATYAQYDTKYDGRPEDKLINLRFLTDSFYFGVRRAPYSSSKRYNPFTIKDTSDFTATDYDIAGEYFAANYDPDDLRGESGMYLPSNPSYVQIRMANQTHNAGTLWANIIWQVRSQVIKAVAREYGEDIFLETQNMTDAQKPKRPIGRIKGNDIMLGYMIDALKMVPDNSNFNDNRDGFLSADYFLYDAQYEEAMWAGFAYRGMGHGSLMAVGGSGTGTGTRIALTESYKMPHLYVRNAHYADSRNDIVIDDTNGNQNGAIEPGETVTITIPVHNPWRRSDKTAHNVTATLTVDHPYITMVQGTDTTDFIAPDRTHNFTFKVKADGDISMFKPGEPLNFNLNLTTSNQLYGSDNTIFTDGSDYLTGKINVASDPKTHDVALKLRMGKRDGKDTPVVYSTAPNMGIVVPAAPEGRGATSYLTIEDDLEIADVAIRIDDISGPAFGAIGYKAAVGFGTQMKTASTSASAVEGIKDLTFTDSASGTWNSTSNPTGNTYRTTAKPGNNFAEVFGTSSKGQWGIVMGEGESARSAANQARGYSKINQWSVVVTPTKFVFENQEVPGSVDDRLGFTDANALSNQSINAVILPTTEEKALTDAIYADGNFDVYVPNNTTGHMHQAIWVVNDSHQIQNNSNAKIVDIKSKEGLWDKLYDMLPEDRQNDDAAILSLTTEFLAYTLSDDASIYEDNAGAILPIEMKFPYTGNTAGIYDLFIFYEFIDKYPEIFEEALGEDALEGLATDEIKEPVMLFGESSNAIMSMTDAVAKGIVSVSGGNLVIKYYVLDGTGTPKLAKDTNYFIIPDGYRNGLIMDPVWVVKTTLVEQPEPPFPVDTDELDEIIGFDNLNINGYDINTAEMPAEGQDAFLSAIRNHGGFDISANEPLYIITGAADIVDDETNKGAGSTALTAKDKAAMLAIISDDRQDSANFENSISAKFDVHLAQEGGILPVTVTANFAGGTAYENFLNTYVFYTYIEEGIDKAPVLVIGPQGSGALLTPKEAADMDGMVTFTHNSFSVTYYALDGVAEPALVAGKLVIADGVKNAYLRDPMWFVSTEDPTGEPGPGPGPGPEPGKKGSSSDCNALALGLAGLVVLPMLRKRS